MKMKRKSVKAGKKREWERGRERERVNSKLKSNWRERERERVKREIIRRWGEKEQREWTYIGIRTHDRIWLYIYNRARMLLS